MPSLSKPFVLNNRISVKDAAAYSRNNTQYVRRLFRLGSLTSLKLDQLWLIEMKPFEEYLTQAGNSEDHRFGSKQSLDQGEKNNHLWTHSVCSIFQNCRTT